MNAAVQIERSPQLDQYERAALRKELGRWGGWMDRQLDYTGHRSIENVAAFVSGGGGGVQGHRVLCLDMPASVWSTNARVNSLRFRQKVGVWTCYVRAILADGSLMPWDDRARRIGVSGSELSRIHTQALMRLAGLVE